MRPLEWALIQCDQRREKRLGHRHTGKTTCRHRKDGHLPAKEMPQRATNPFNTLLSDFWPPELREKTLVLSKPPGLWYFARQPEGINTPHDHSLLPVDLSILDISYKWGHGKPRGPCPRVMAQQR